MSADWPHGYGYCHCGCGELTSVPAKSDVAHGYIRGVPVRFLKGHSARVIEGRKLHLDERSYTVEDRGYLTPCWIWQGKPNPDGYGVYSRGEGSSLAHRRMWEKHNGPIPDGLQTDHLCRVRICVNYSHIELVTLAENVRRGRVIHYPASLIAEIRASSESNRMIGQRLGIHPGYIWEIRTGRARQYD